jgi:hypothetical protein
VSSGSPPRDMSQSSGQLYFDVDEYMRLSILGVILGVLCAIAVLVYEKYSSSVIVDCPSKKPRSSIEDILGFVWQRSQQKQLLSENGGSGGSGTTTSSV